MVCARRLSTTMVVIRIDRRCLYTCPAYKLRTLCLTYLQAIFLNLQTSRRRRPLSVRPVVRRSSVRRRPAPTPNEHLAIFATRGFEL